MRQSAEMVDIKLEDVDTIPASKGKRHKGESKYSEIIQKILDLPIKKPKRLMLRSPHVKPLSVYSSLIEIVRQKKLKNVRLVIRGKEVFAERMF